MRKQWSMLMILIMSLFVMPVAAFAAPNQNPIDQIKDKMKFNFNVLNGMDFIFTPLGIVLSILIAFAFVFLIVKIMIKIFKAATGKGTIKDKWFWIETGLVLLIVFFVISGAFLDILSSIYDWTSDQDLVEQTN
ncbi:Uncharacterised protein [Mycobacterium tuberculosis]|nr:Uncharacterised protein [Mycobacterium tuberculosis]